MSVRPSGTSLSKSLSSLSSLRYFVLLCLKIKLVVCHILGTEPLPILYTCRCRQQDQGRGVILHDLGECYQQPRNLESGSSKEPQF